MTNDDIREIIRLLLTEKPMVKYTKNDDVSYPDKLPPAPYGYYEIEECSMGPMFFEVCCPDKMEEGVAPLAHLKTLTKEFYIYKPTRYTKCKERGLYREKLSLYKDIIKAIQRLPSQNSNLEPNEAKSRFYHFRDPDSKKKRLNERYLYARVMYDTMYKMIQGSDVRMENSTDKPGWQTIYSTLGDGYVEKIEGMMVTYKNQYGHDCQRLSVYIPGIDVQWLFEDREDWVSMMMFGAYKTLSDIATNEKCIDCHIKNVPSHIKCNQRTDPDCKKCHIGHQVQFTRNDPEYTALMRQIALAHQKAK